MKLPRVNTKHQSNPLPYRDPSVPVDERISDLLDRMTLPEKVRQLDVYSGEEFMTHTPSTLDRSDVDVEKLAAAAGDGGLGCVQIRNADAAVNNRVQNYMVEHTRLGIPALFSEEALHGLIWPGCTVFPQQIALGATFDPELARRQGRAIATECRALGVHETWGPVVDLARDPRWGRVEEGYGEDTLLTGRLAAAMVEGLQGGGGTDDRRSHSQRHRGGGTQTLLRVRRPAGWTQLCSGDDGPSGTRHVLPADL